MNTPKTDKVAQMVSTDSEHSDLSAYNIIYSHAEELETHCNALAAALERIVSQDDSIIDIRVARAALAEWRKDK